MSDFQLQPRPRVMGRKMRIAVVASRFNSAFTDAMIENTLSELLKLLPEAVIELHQVPGAFEIPFSIEYLARHSNVDVLIALGVIIRGETAHGDMVAECVTRALQDTAVKHLIPVINEVLLVNDKTQATERTMGEKLNRGREAARAASAMLAALEKLRKARPIVRNFQKSPSDG